MISKEDAMSIGRYVCGMYTSDSDVEIDRDEYVIYMHRYTDKEMSCITNIKYLYDRLYDVRIHYLTTLEVIDLTAVSHCRMTHGVLTLMSGEDRASGLFPFYISVPYEKGE